MSVRWMAVQYLGGGSILRLPIVNASDMDKPFGESVLERDVKRIIINPFSESRQTFVPEEDSVKLRELVQDFDKCLDTALCLAHGAGYPVMPDQKLFDSLRPRMRELGIEVEDV